MAMVVLLEMVALVAQQEAKVPLVNQETLAIQEIME
jgi:hypothetical protein